MYDFFSLLFCNVLHWFHIIFKSPAKVTTLIRFFKYIGDRGRHLGAKHVISFPCQPPGDHLDSNYASKWNNTSYIPQHSCMELIQVKAGLSL